MKYYVNEKNELEYVFTEKELRKYRRDSLNAYVTRKKRARRRRFRNFMDSFLEFLFLLSIEIAFFAYVLYQL